MNALKTSGNPFIRNKFSADPTAIVFGGKVFLYAGHDEATEGIEEYVASRTNPLDTKGPANPTLTKTKLKK